MTDPISPTDLGNLAEKLGVAAKSLAEADKTRAEADKSRADADKVRAETDKERAAIEKDKRLLQNALDTAAADLETKKIANEKARDEAEAARIDKLITQLSGAVPDLSKLQKNTVTFSEGKVLRQSEANAIALSKSASQIADEIVKALATKSDQTVFVTSEPRMVAAIASYRQISDEAELLTARLGKAMDDAQKVLDLPVPGRAIADELDVKTIVPGSELALAAVAGKALTELASLFEIDVAVSSSTADIPAATVHAAVIQELLKASSTRKPPLVIQHEWARLPDPESSLLKAVKTLVDKDHAVAAKDLALQSQIAALGDPESDRAAALKIANDKTKTDDERRDARVAADAATKRQERLDALKLAKTNLEAAAGKAKAFADRVSTVSADTGASPLTSAYSVEPLATAKSDRCILLLGGARAEANQVVVTRRILAPRLHVSTSLEVQYLLFDDTQILAAGRSTGSAAYAAKITHTSADWVRIKALGDPVTPGDPAT